MSPVALRAAGRGRRWALVLSLLACARTEPVRDAGPPAPLDDCTLATPLVPGVPGSPGHLIASQRNPNGASELAALMRTFVDDWSAARTALEADAGVPPRFATHRRLRCAWPTVPSDRTAAFDAMARRYLDAVQAFDAAPQRERYERVLDACKACHEATCGGPLVVIEGLRSK